MVTKRRYCHWLDDTLTCCLKQVPGRATGRCCVHGCITHISPCMSCQHFPPRCSMQPVPPHKAHSKRGSNRLTANTRTKNHSNASGGGSFGSGDSASSMGGGSSGHEKAPARPKSATGGETSAVQPRKASCAEHGTASGSGSGSLGQGRQGARITGAGGQAAGQAAATGGDASADSARQAGVHETASAAVCEGGVVPGQVHEKGAVPPVCVREVPRAAAPAPVTHPCHLHATPQVEQGAMCSRAAALRADERDVVAAAEAVGQEP